MCGFTNFHVKINFFLAPATANLIGESTGFSSDKSTSNINRNAEGLALLNCKDQDRGFLLLL